MLAPAPKLNLPKTGTYLKRWTTAKAKFKTVTGKKKPAPIKKVKIFHEKIGTIERRKGTGVETTLKAAEKALPGAFRNAKTRTTYVNAVIKFRGTCYEYFKLVDEAIKTAPPEVDPKVWRAAILALKKELRHIQLELAGYQESASRTVEANAAVAKNAENLMEGLRDNVDTAQAWVLLRKRRLTSHNEVDLDDYNGAGMQLARKISQGLMNITKLKVGVGFVPDRDRGPVPDAVEDALEAFGGQKRMMNKNLPANTARAEYVRRLDEFEDALAGLDRWLG